MCELLMEVIMKSEYIRKFSSVIMVIVMFAGTFTAVPVFAEGGFDVIFEDWTEQDTGTLPGEAKIKVSISGAASGANTIQLGMKFDGDLEFKDIDFLVDVPELPDGFALGEKMEDENSINVALISNKEKIDLSDGLFVVTFEGEVGKSVTLTLDNDNEVTWIKADGAKTYANKAVSETVPSLYAQNTWKYENIGLKDTEGGYMKLTGKYAHSGDYAMYMKGENGDGYMIVQPRTTVPFKAEKSYKIEFYAMCTNGATQVTAEWERFGTINGNAWTKSAPDSKGWIKHSRTVTINANRGNIWFLLDAADEVIIDDISVYILDENGNPTGNNLVDGDFEDVLLPEGEDVLSPDSDIIYTGDYTIVIRYDVLFEPEPPEIEISRSILLCSGANGAAVVDKTSSAVGEVVTITVTPYDGYELDTISGVEVTKVNETTYTFTMPDENVEICVTFKKIPLDIWESLSESGYYIENGQKLGIIRYLFDVTFLDEVGNISESGIKYIKAGNIAENVGESAFSGSSNTGTATTFFGDIVNITEDRKDDRYYAVGYIIADGKTYWSKPVEGIPNFEKRVNY